MASKLLKPRAFSSKDKLGIVALASPVEAGTLQSGLKYLNSIGLKSKVALKPSQDFGKHKHLFFSDSVKARVTALEALFKDKSIGAVLSVRGGYGSAHLLPKLNFANFKKNKKLLVGFSDITALLVTLYQRLGLVSIHGPSLITQGAKEKEDAEIRQSLKLLRQYISGKILNPFANVELKHISGPKIAQGRLIGGNLTILLSLLGTDFEPDFANHILFLEDVAEVPYRVHRSLSQLKLAGKFKGLKGILIGEFSPPGDPKKLRGPSYLDVFKDIFAGTGIPIFAGLPVGHGSKNYPIAIGVMAKIVKNRLEILEKPVV